MNEKLSIEAIREHWSKTYNTEGKPDWSHLFPFYHEDIVFQDSIQRVEGKEAFMGVCKRLADRCQELKMNILSMAQNGDEIFMEWEMTMIFQKTPSSVLYGCSKLTIHQDGRVIRQRDYYDLWGDIFDNIPRFGPMYRRFMHRKFG